MQNVIKQGVFSRFPATVCPIVCTFEDFLDTLREFAPRVRACFAEFFPDRRSWLLLKELALEAMPRIQ
jgi:hypothetical protein